ncbi:MAG: mercury resistance system periplasmic binding protein MerP [Alphaproteobacteria bacterium]|nr:mercury resistance system periplasmic binding protein MerP [Rhodospirillales bacterium]MCW9046245.1 mercury resistance system periplasmic binding protein MerP [Alphaproteobacteria bacterium]
MKQIFIGTLFIVGLLISSLSFAAEKTVKLNVENMYCATCPFVVKKSLQSVKGVSQVAVSYEEQSATVTFDDKLTTLAQLTSATNEAGYPSALNKGN